ncbi:hypothetical protein ART_1094 [Arthrobacter sp. PAMC 25486]|nr:hypothetical protein ART_1094 [Arthrobacter sp. PAMC 25486]
MLATASREEARRPPLLTPQSPNYPTHNNRIYTFTHTAGVLAAGEFTKARTGSKAGHRPDLI